jgi:predicted alpha/beta-fold hydrolase
MDAKAPGAATTSSPPTPDFSLRANGNSYIQRANEVDTLLERIESSAASVVGLSGVRGAGKSSLAKKVLNTCRDKGYFTLMIHLRSGMSRENFSFPFVSESPNIAAPCYN